MKVHRVLNASILPERPRNYATSFPDTRPRVRVRVITRQQNLSNTEIIRAFYHENTRRSKKMRRQSARSRKNTPCFRQIVKSHNPNRAI